METSTSVELGDEIPDFINYPVPTYIEYLLLPSTPLDFHAVVGNSSTVSKRIGVMKWMLIARSKVFRVMLLESELRAEREFIESDLDPATFTHFLVFLYGHDNTPALKFEDSVKLLTAADKYEVGDLKSKLGELIKFQVTPINVLIVLQNGPVCEKEPSLWEKVTELLQNSTKEVFGAPQFLNASPEALLHILQQDALSVLEIDVWKAALKWAEHRVHSQEGEVSPEFLNVTLRSLLKHIRICTLSYEQLGKEVFPSGIFTEEEIRHIFASLNKQEKNTTLVTVCNEIEVRACVNDSKVQIFENTNDLGFRTFDSHINLQPKDRNLKLYSAIFGGIESGSANQTYSCKGKIQISNISEPERPLEIAFNKTVEYKKDFRVPLKSNGRFVILKANVRYRINLKFEAVHSVLSNAMKVTECASFRLTQVWLRPRYGYHHGSHVKILKYKVL